MEGKKLGIVAVVVLCLAISTPVVSAEFGSVRIVPWGHSLCESEYDVPEIELYESAGIEMSEPSESPKSKMPEISKGNHWEQDLKPIEYEPWLIPKSWLPEFDDVNEPWSSDYEPFDYDELYPDVYPDFEPGVPGSPFSGDSDDELPDIDPWHPWPPDMP